MFDLFLVETDLVHPSSPKIGFRYIQPRNTFFNGPNQNFRRIQKCAPFRRGFDMLTEGPHQRGETRRVSSLSHVFFETPLEIHSHWLLGGGNSNIFHFHPELWGNDSHFDEYFSKGLKSPLRLGSPAVNKPWNWAIWKGVFDKPDPYGTTTKNPGFQSDRWWFQII